jgi:uncharacterized Tic20 family protein
MAFCVACNKEVNTGKFCNTCGRQLVDSAAAASDSIQGPETTSNISYKQFAMWSHLAPLLVSVGSLLTQGVAGLFAWLPGLLIRNSANATAFDKRHATESLNFQLSFLIYLVATTIFGFFTPGFLGFVLLLPLGITQLVFNILAITTANAGGEYRYPLTIRFVK